MAEYVDQPWAKQAVASVDAAAAEWNADRPKAERIHIVWGHPEDGPGYDTPDNMQFGLLNLNEVDFELRITEPQDGAPTRIRVDVQMDMGRFVVLRVTPREIFNMLQDLCDNCSLILFRRDGSDKIDIFGVQTHLFAEALTGSVLAECLSLLAFTHNNVLGRVISDDGPDYWEEAGEDDDDEDEDDDGLDDDE
jgi:hypothetical protein